MLYFPHYFFISQLIDEGITGFTFAYDDTRDDIQSEQIQRANPKELVRKAANLDRKVIRKTAESRWSLDQMAKNYEKVYRSQLANLCNGQEDN